MVISWRAGGKMMLQVQCRFYPVGQGLFYGGVIREQSDGDVKFSFVYDCGSSSKKSFLQNSIGEFKDTSGKRLDILVISHFDKDHICGLPQLIRNIRIKKLILPFYSNIERLFLYVKYLNDNGGRANKDIRKLILNTEEYFGKKAEEIVFISPEKNKDRVNNDSKKNSQNKKYSRKIVDQEYKAHFEKLWEFKFFNLIGINKDVERCFLCNLVRHGINVLDLGNVNGLVEIAESKSLLTKVKSAYELTIMIFTKGNRSINDTSIVVYSGPICEDVNSIKFLPDYRYEENDEKPKDTCNNKNRFGTLLTGDLNFNSIAEMEKERAFFDDFLEGRELFTQVYLVPHHGSEKNYNKIIFEKFGIHVYAVISYGKENRYKHPHDSTINAISDIEHISYHVNQTFSYMYSVEIDINKYFGNNVIFED